MEETNKHVVSDEVVKLQRRTIRRRPVVAPNSKLNSTTEPVQVPLEAVQVPHALKIHRKPKIVVNKGAGELTDIDSLELLKDRYDNCIKICNDINKEYSTLNDIIKTNKIKDVGLNYDAKLFDLLVKKVLLPSDWENQLYLLINIPTSIKGAGILKGGDYFEALFQLAFAINIIPQFKDFKLDFHEINKYKEVKKMEGTYLYEQRVLNSGGNQQVQGISDICFLVNDGSSLLTDTKSTYKCGQKPVEIQNMNGKYYFFSVKNFIKEKTVSKSYDIPLLQAQSNNLKNVEFKNTRVCVCIRDKTNFIARLERTKMDFIKSRLDTILGYDEIISYFKNFRINFFSKYPEVITEEEISNKIIEIYPKDKQIKPSLQLFYHQELVADSVVNSINEKAVKFRAIPHFLTIGVLPRGGKSYIAGGIINRLIKDKDSYNILFLTSAVSETMSQFKDDLINKFSDFDKFKFIDIREYRRKKLVQYPGQYNFIFMSRELASMTEKLLGNNVAAAKDSSKLLEQVTKRIDNPHFDLIFFDEAHKGILTETTANNFKSAFMMFKIPIILMTATYKKTSTVLDDVTDLFVWDLFDIKDMTNLPNTNSKLHLENFTKSDVVTRYGPLAIDILQKRINLGQTLLNIAEPYINFPQPVFISPTFSDDTISKLHLTQSGYNHSDIFKINHDSALLDDTINWKLWQSLLVNREHALILRDYLTPTDEELDEIDQALIGDKKINRNDKALIRIFRKAQLNQTRPSYGTPFTAIMFLPTHLDNISIGALCRIWGSFMAQTKYWGNNFTILTLSELVHPIRKHNTPYKATVAAEATEAAVEEAEAEAEGEGEAEAEVEAEVEAEEAEEAEGVAEEEAEEGEGEAEAEVEAEVEAEGEAEGEEEGEEEAEEGEEEAAVEGEEEEAEEAEEAEVEGGSYYELIQYGGDYPEECVKSGMCLREKFTKKMDLKERIISIERESLKQGKGLLILTGKVAQMGISLPCADVAFLLDSDSEADDIIQKMFRALTDSPGKKFGFIVDVNIKRIANALFEYDIKKDKLRKESKPITGSDRITNILELCDWGYDAYSMSDNSGIDYTSFMEKIKNKIFNKLDLLKISSEQVKNKVSEVLLNNIEIFNDLKRIIRGDKVVIGKKEIISEEASEGLHVKKPKSVRRSMIPILNEEGRLISPENINKNKIYEDNMRNLVQTFINSLLFRESERINWNNELTLKHLLDIYDKDKEKAADVIKCYCSNMSAPNMSAPNNACNYSNNIYERVYCDISNYIINTSKNTLTLDESNKVKNAMDIIYSKIFSNINIQIIVQSYIDSFIVNIDKKVKKGGFNTTRKKRTY